MTPPEEDLRCLERLRAGEKSALAELYDRHASMMYGIAMRILRDRSAAEETVQDAWVQVWKRHDTFDPARGSVGAWLTTVARTRALDRWRREATRRRVTDRVELEPTVGPVEPAGEVAASDAAQRVRAALATLEPRQRQVIEVAYFEGLSQSEIAERLGAPLGTVKYWTRQGLLKLKELLPGDVRP
jgi:RNA polymerase sigma-70 factor (ECF subfamily)